MPVLSALGPFLNLAIQILQMIGTAEAMKYIDELNQAKMDLEAEIAKGYNSDDAKVEALYAKIQILGQTVQSQLSVFQSKGSNAPTVPVASPAPAADPAALPK